MNEKIKSIVGDVVSEQPYSFIGAKSTLSDSNGHAVMSMSKSQSCPRGKCINIGLEMEMTIMVRGS